METCKYGLGASTRKPPTARWVWRWVLSPHKTVTQMVTPMQAISPVWMLKLVWDLLQMFALSARCVIMCK